MGGEEENMNKPCREVTLLDRAFDMRYRKATDRREMLFALRSMLPEETRRHFVVGYGKSVDELYAEFYKEVKRADTEELKFVRLLEKMRLDEVRSRVRGAHGGSMGGACRGERGIWDFSIDPYLT